MTTKPMPWSLKGVSPEAREAARTAAAADDLPIGTWLSRIIREVAAAEHADAARPPEPRMSSIERAMSRLGGNSSGR